MSSNIAETAESSLQDKFGNDLSVEQIKPLSGGCINEAAKLETTEGPFFIKWSQDPRAYQQFKTEKLALETMRKAETTLRIPAPYLVQISTETSPSFLMTEFIERGSKSRDYDEKLGRGLAKLHQYSESQFGFYEDTYCGETLQPNPWTGDWIEFYRDCRLGFLLELIGGSQNAFDRKQKELFDRLLANLDSLLETDRNRPALLHGDLWSGNVMADENGDPVIIDPAAYFGAPEAEFGMMFLFGGFSNAVYSSYQDIMDSPDGWRQRSEIYKLYHVLNHYHIFGGHYGRQAVELTRRIIE